MATKQVPDTVQLVDDRGVTVSVAADKADARIAGGYKPLGGRKAKAAAAAPTEYDPGSNTVADVVAYLTEADDAERTRVLDVESAGKQRVGITGWAPEPVTPEV